MQWIQLILLLSVSAFASAEVYRWVDENGKVHYGDRAPRQEAKKLEQVQLDTAPPSLDAEAERNRQRMRELSASRASERERQQKQAAKKQKEREKREKNCKRLKKTMMSEERAGVLFYYDDDGNRVNWTSEQRKAYQEKMQRIQKEHCS